MCQTCNYWLKENFTTRRSSKNSGDDEKKTSLHDVVSRNGEDFLSITRRMTRFVYIDLEMSWYDKEQCHICVLISLPSVASQCMKVFF